MSFREGLFWACALCVAYTYVFYPLGVRAVAGLRPRRVRLVDAPAPSVSIVLAAYNEEDRIGRRVRELAGLVASAGLTGEVVVASDGSTDGTAEAARGCGGGNVRVVELPVNRGKAVALSEACAAARSEVVAFADARQTWGEDALVRLLENFSDPDVGAVSGQLILETAPGVMAGVGLYWRYETWLRRNESRVHSVVGVTGAISAVRRRLFSPIPPGTVLDDVYWPMAVAMRGYRVVFDGRARAYDRLPDRVHDEFRRKVRTLGGNFQLLTLRPSLLLPGRNPIWLQFVSHKVLRLVVPWALQVMLGLSLALGGPLYTTLLGFQVAFYALGLAGLNRGVGARSRASSAAASFVVLNVAAWLAFWVWVTGGVAGSWGKVVYQPPVDAPGDSDPA